MDSRPALLSTVWCTWAEWGDTGLAMIYIDIIKVLCSVIGFMHLVDWAFKRNTIPV